MDGCTWWEDVQVMWILYYKLINCHSAVISDMMHQSLRTPQDRVSEPLSLSEGHIQPESLLQTPLPAPILLIFISRHSVSMEPKVESCYVEILETLRSWGRGKWLRLSIMQNSRLSTWSELITAWQQSPHLRERFQTCKTPGLHCYVPFFFKTKRSRLNFLLCSLDVFFF